MIPNKDANTIDKIPLGPMLYLLFYFMVVGQLKKVEEQEYTHLGPWQKIRTAGCLCRGQPVELW